MRLSSFLDKPVVVYFYGADKTPAATAEATSFRDAWLRLNEKIGMILGVSSDDRIMHRDFATEQGLPLLVGGRRKEGDRASVRRASGRRAEQTDYLHHREGRQDRSCVPGRRPEKHVAEVLAAVSAD